MRRASNSSEDGVGGPLTVDQNEGSCPELHSDNVCSLVYVSLNLLNAQRLFCRNRPTQRGLSVLQNVQIVRR